MKTDVIRLLDLQEFQNKTDYSNLTTLSYLQSDEYLTGEALLNARLNNISIVNFTNCEILLRKNDLIGKNDRIIINQVEFYNQLSNKTNETIFGTSLHYKFLNSRTNEPMNTTICENSTMTVLIPMDLDLLGLNLTEIIELQENGMYNVFDKHDQLFNNICLSYIQNSTDSDTTVDYRRKHFFQNYSIECKPKNVSGGSIIDSSVNCTFEGVDEYGFIRCDCEFAGDLHVETEFKETILEDFIKWNVEIVGCYLQFLIKVIMII